LGLVNIIESVLSPRIDGPNARNPIQMIDTFVTSMLTY